MTCSDHGFTTIESEVYLNRWLIENGCLRLNGTDGFKGIAPVSRAFCLDPSRIYLHTEERYSRGNVKKSEYEKERARLKEELSGLEFEGRRIITDVPSERE
jgi:predicted AlkP superfamily phosphohydrolase/phosphomutase